MVEHWSEKPGVVGSIPTRGIFVYCSSEHMPKNKVIFADDDTAMRSIVSGLLQQNGYEVLVAKDGEETVRLTKENLPAAVIMDIKMPNKNGIEACRELKANSATKQIPVIMLTGAAGLEEINQAMSCGAISCLTKPCDTKSLLETLSNAITPGKQTRWTSAKRRDTGPAKN